MFSFYRLIILKSIVICTVVFNVHTAYAANVTAVKIAPFQYRLQGSVTSSDLIPKNSDLSYGVFIRYMTDELPNAALYRTDNKTCSTNITKATQEINKLIASTILDGKDNIYNSTRDNSIIIQCVSIFTLPFGGWEVIIPGKPTPASCSVGAPSEVNFGTVNEGDTKSIQIQAPIQCDKAASVRLTLSANSTAGILTMNGTVIKYGINGTSPSAVIKVSAGITSAASLNFTLSDTGNIAGEKQGYILLVSEVL